MAGHNPWDRHGSNFLNHHSDSMEDRQTFQTAIPLKVREKLKYLMGTADLPGSHVIARLIEIGYDADIFRL